MRKPKYCPVTFILKTLILYVKAKSLEFSHQIFEFSYNIPWFHLKKIHLKSNFCLTHRKQVKQLDVSTLQSWIRTIVVLIPLNKMFCLFIFFILVPNFLLGYFDFFFYFVWTTTSKFFEFLFECFFKFEILVQNFFSLKWFPLGTQYTMYLLGIRFIFSTFALKCPFWK